MEKFDKWNINDYEANINKPCFIEYLYYLKTKGKSKQILETIKASGFFISYKENLEIEENSKQRIETFIKEELGMKERKIYESYVREAFLLSEKRNQISRVVDDFLDIYEVNVYNLIEGVVQLLKDIENNKNLSPQFIFSTKEYTIFSFSAILKVLKYYSKEREWFTNLAVADPTQLLNFANALHELNEVIQAWMFGEISICLDEDGLHISEDINGESRNRDKILSSLLFWDIKDVKELSHSLDEFLNGVSELKIYRDCLENKVEEYFYTKDFDIMYLGVKLESWITAYTYFFELAKKSTLVYEEFLKKDLIDELVSRGIRDDEAILILNAFEYKKNSLDIFDSFLIPQNGLLIFVPQIYKNIDPSRALMSLLGKQNVSDIKRKGEDFERYISALISKCGVKVFSNIKVNFKGEEYEIDLLFPLDDVLFVCECKTQMQHMNMRGYFRNLKELEYYIAKFKRNKKFFFESENGKQILRQHLGKQLDISSFTRIEYVYISNILFTQTIYDDIYITDDVTIYKYFKRQPSLAYSFNLKKGYLEAYALFPEFFEGPIEADTFIKLLKNKEKELDLNNRRIYLWKNESLEQFQIDLERYIVNYQDNCLFNT